MRSNGATLLKQTLPTLWSYRTLYHPTILEDILIGTCHFYPSVCMSVRPSVCLSLCLSLCLSVKNRVAGGIPCCGGVQYLLYKKTCARRMCECSDLNSLYSAERLYNSNSSTSSIGLSVLLTISFMCRVAF